MNYKKTNAIILNRINYSEADRIITVLSNDQGKLRLLAKGVRKSTSKLAGGIELFSESTIQYIKGKGDIDTLVSARINRNFSNISKNLKSTNVGYEVISAIDSITEHNAENSHYKLLKENLELLDGGLDELLVLGKFYANLLEISGHSLNLEKDTSGSNLNEKNNYIYNFESDAFEKSNYGYPGTCIKVIKILFTQSSGVLKRITGMDDELKEAIVLLKSIADYYLQLKRKRF